MKKDDWFDTAQNHFIEDQMTLVEIASIIPVTTRTLGDWKSEGHWEEKRKNYIELHTSTNEKMLKLASMILDKGMNRYITDPETNEKHWVGPSKDEVNMIAKLTGSIPQMKEIETVKAHESDSDKKPKDVGAVVSEIKKSLFGE